MKKIYVKCGDKFGRLTVIDEVGKDKFGSIMLRCKCDCGNEKTVLKSNLISGKTQSCGCYRSETVREMRRKYNKIIKDEDNKVAYIYANNTNNAFIIDIEDFEKVKEISWFELSNGYMANKSAGRFVTLHRYIMNPPKDKVIDHLNHDKKDNRKSNLRICSQSENIRNVKTPPKGISEEIVCGKISYKVQMCGVSKRFSNIDEAKKFREKILKDKYLINGNLWEEE